jgi:hypothetical protein
MVGTLFFAWNGMKSILSITTIEKIDRWSIALPKCALALAPLLSARHSCRRERADQGQVD